MKLSIESSKALAEAVAWTARAVHQRPVTPVLAGVLLEADGDGLTLSAFDYDVSARATIAADVAEPGKVLIPGRVLAEITKSLPSAPVDLVLSGTEVVLTCGAVEFGLLTMPAGDYPTLPEIPATVGTVDADVLRAVVGQIQPACSKDDTLPMLTGIRVDIDGAAVSLGSTDRYRIHARHLTWTPAADDAQHGVVVPGHALLDIAKRLPAGPVAVGLTGGLIALTGAGRATTVRLLEDQFIDYRARLDAEEAKASSHATVDVAPLIDAVKRVALMAERGGTVRLDFTPGEVTVRAGGADMGRGREALPANLDGPAVEVAFGPIFLLDALDAVAGSASTVRVDMTRPAAPTLFIPAGEDPALRTLVQAVRLSS